MYPKWIVWSSTFWFNFLVTLIAVGELLLNQGWIAANPAAVAAITAIIGIINIVLRFKSKQPVALKNPDR